jgi:hypothetical protein
MLKKSFRLVSGFLGVLLLVSMLAGSCLVFAANNKTFTGAHEIYSFVRDGYNQGTQGPISITKGTLKSGFSSKTVYFVTLSGTELVLNQSTGVLTDLLSGFNLNNV